MSALRPHAGSWHCLAAALVLAALAPAAPAQALEGTALLDALRAGGYVLYFRHAATEWAQEDRIERAGDWTSCDPARVRQLSADGRAAATEAGEAMRTLRVPVAQVFASPYCRTVQTAELLGLGPVHTTSDVMNLRVADYFGGREAIVASARARLARPPPAGANTVLVAHGNVAIAATGVYPGEGEALVFRPDGAGGFGFAGRVAPGAWRALDR